jgi:antitoxin component YwqK of YwqJK toxin-antitoxin module
MREYDTVGTVEKAVLYKNGVVIGEGIVLDNGERNGPWKDYYPDGSLKAEGKYEKGKQTGEWKFYYPGKKLEQTGRFTKAGKLDGVWKWYYPGGRLQREENYRAGLKDGMSTSYDESGTVVEEGEFVDDKEDGPWFELIGDTYMRGVYRDGLRNGTWIYCYLNPGEKGTDSIWFFKGNFIEDYPDGKHIYRYENGKTKLEGKYIMGKREGDWYLYNEDGTLFLVISYKNGVEVRYDGAKIKPPFESEEE